MSDDESGFNREDSFNDPLDDGFGGGYADGDDWGEEPRDDDSAVPASIAATHAAPAAGASAAAQGKPSTTAVTVGAGEGAGAGAGSGASASGGDESKGGSAGPGSFAASAAAGSNSMPVDGKPHPAPPASERDGAAAVVALGAAGVGAQTGTAEAAAPVLNGSQRSRRFVDQKQRSVDDHPSVDPSTSAQHYRCLSPAEMRAERTRLERSVCELSGLEQDVVSTLLRASQWSSERVTTALFEDPRARLALFKSAKALAWPAAPADVDWGVVAGRPSAELVDRALVVDAVDAALVDAAVAAAAARTSTGRAGSGSSGAGSGAGAGSAGLVRCGVCWDDFPVDQTATSPCNVHPFCLECYVAYIAGYLRTRQREAVRMVCMAPKCHVALPDAMVKWVVDGALRHGITLPPVFPDAVSAPVVPEAAAAAAGGATGGVGSPLTGSVAAQAKPRASPVFAASTSSFSSTSTSSSVPMAAPTALPRAASSASASASASPAPSAPSWSPTLGPTTSPTTSPTPPSSQLSSVRDVWPRYETLLDRAYVEESRRYKWCPGAGCDYVS